MTVGINKAASVVGTVYRPTAPRDPSVTAALRFQARTLKPNATNIFWAGAFDFSDTHQLKRIQQEYP
jgi:hypothetical protein